MTLFRTALLAGIALMAGLVAVQFISWRGPGCGIPLRQKIARTCFGVIFICLLGLVLAGNICGILFTDNRADLVGHPALTFMYGLACMGLGFLLVGLALFDVRETLRAYRRDSRRIEASMKDGGSWES
jgi:hypothetical protein